MFANTVATTWAVFAHAARKRPRTSEDATTLPPTNSVLVALSDAPPRMAKTLNSSDTANQPLVSPE